MPRIAGVTPSFIPASSINVLEDKTLSSIDVEKFEKILERFEPDKKGRLQNVNKYIERYKELFVYDPSQIYFHVEASHRSNQLILSGDVHYPELKDGLIDILNHLGFKNIIDNILVFPDPKLQDKKFSLANQYTVTMYFEPDSESEMVTEVLYGDPIFLLKLGPKNFVLGQSIEGYLGWIPTSSVTPMDVTQYVEWSTGPRVMFIEQFESGSISIPVGTELKYIEEGKAELPDKKIVSIEGGIYKVYNPGEDPHRKIIIDFCKKFLETPYLWGGKTNKGIDCSGFVQMSFRAGGINLPRDAAQQCVSGEIVANRDFNLMETGDLLFFIGDRGNITHTGICLDRANYIHSTSGGVQISKLNISDDDKENNRLSSFVQARRMLRF